MDFSDIPEFTKLSSEARRSGSGGATDLHMSGKTSCASEAKRIAYALASRGVSQGAMQHLFDDTTIETGRAMCRELLSKHLLDEGDERITALVSSVESTTSEPQTGFRTRRRLPQLQPLHPRLQVAASTRVRQRQQHGGVRTRPSTEAKKLINDFVKEQQGLHPVTFGTYCEERPEHEQAVQSLCNELLRQQAETANPTSKPYRNRSAVRGALRSAWTYRRNPEEAKARATASRKRARETVTEQRAAAPAAGAEDAM